MQIEKKVVIFGTGEAAIHILDALPKEKVMYFVDNDEKKWHSKFKGYSVFPPDYLCQLSKNEKDSILIIVASLYFFDICRQLMSYGLIEDQHFINGVKLNQQTHEDRTQLLMNDLPKVTIDDYYGAQVSLINFLEERYNLFSVYNFGDIGTPGISDLDLLIILEEPTHTLNSIMELIRKFIDDNHLDHIFVHPPILLNKEMTQYVHLFHTVSNLKNVFGSEVNWGEDVFTYEKMLIWNYHFYYRIWEWKGRETIGSRRSCLLLKNLYHSIRNNNNYSEANIPIGPVIDEVEAVRKLALSGNLDISRYWNSVCFLWEKILQQESFAKEFNILEISYFGITLFSNKYFDLRHQFLIGEGEFVKSIKAALTKLELNYMEASRLFGSVPLFDFGKGVTNL